MSPEPKKQRALYLYPPILIFLALLWLPTADFFLRLDRTEEALGKAKSTLFPEPPQALSNLRSYLADLEAYYNDHFGFRNLLIRWQNRLKLGFFGDSPVPNQVLMGEENWLFYLGGGMLDHHLGKVTFSEKELSLMRKLVESRRDWLAKRGIAYLLVIAPDKHTIHPEFLPPWMAKIRVRTKLDKFIDHMHAHSNLQVVDLRKPLREAKKQGHQYLLTDSHWHQAASLIGYQTVIKALAKQLPALGSPLEKEDFHFEPVTLSRTDLADMIGQRKPETTMRLVPKILLPSVRTEPEMLKEYNWPAHKRPQVCINDQRPLSALLFRDSFADHWAPWVGYNFGKATLLSTRKWDFPFIEREKPSVVIDQMVERNFNTFFLSELRRNPAPKD